MKWNHPLRPCISICATVQSCCTSSKSASFIPSTTGHLVAVLQKEAAHTAAQCIRQVLLLQGWKVHLQPFPGIVWELRGKTGKPPKSSCSSSFSTKKLGYPMVSSNKAICSVLEWLIHVDSCWFYINIFAQKLPRRVGKQLLNNWYIPCRPCREHIGLVLRLCSQAFVPKNHELSTRKTRGSRGIRFSKSIAVPTPRRRPASPNSPISDHRMKY